MKLDDPDQLPATMTDLDHDTWMLSGRLFESSKALAEAKYLWGDKQNS